jgi:bifunctional N-acetylglucosamine-1-phosphate-uridyltransferase/glucosamine-1-phosphate-acetyltransferase GlmU-like protein
MSTDADREKEAKTKAMMKQDPRFIGRLIGGLDGSMKKMAEEKRKRQEEIDADQKEIDQINSMIASHVAPNMQRLEDNIRQRTALKEELIKNQADQKAQLVSMSTDANKLVRNMMATASKLTRKTASQKLEEARGFSMTTSSK